MASQGPNNPGTAADDSAIGTIVWQSPNLCKVSDGNGAFAGQNIGYTHYLKATNFGFTIPSGATIDGIKVDISKFDYNGTGITDYVVKLVRADGNLGTENKADTVNYWDYSGYVYANYGGSADVWGESFTPENINSSDFGVVISANLAEAYYLFMIRADIDHIRITVYYTEGGPSTAIKTVSGVAKANVKTVDGLAIASVKTVNGLA